jgi:hypothetical protein
MDVPVWNVLGQESSRFQQQPDLFMEQGDVEGVQAFEVVLAPLVLVWLRGPEVSSSELISTAGPLTLSWSVTAWEGGLAGEEGPAICTIRQCMTESAIGDLLFLQGSLIRMISSYSCGTVRCKGADVLQVRSSATGRTPGHREELGCDELGITCSVFSGSVHRVPAHDDVPGGW